MALINDFFYSLRKEGPRSALERTFNYLRFGKGTLNNKKNFSYKNTRNNLNDVLRKFLLAPQLLPDIQDKQPVDIIIPIYNGFEYLQVLVDSLMIGTTFPFRLILIDDCSEDERISRFLNNLNAQKNKNCLEIIARRNKNNLGFVKSVNTGFRLSKGHVVILNTDVEVPTGWLERLIYPFYRYKNIASVTPFTNAGEICSFPVFLKDNEIVEKMSVNEVDYYFRHVLADNNFFDLPTGVGFCMAINRNALRKVGLFNEVEFEKGYGEENDWCQRAVKAGYKNLIAPNLFVYHKHGGSFSSEEKKKIKEENLKKLARLHRRYLDNVSAFIAKDPLKVVRDFILMLLLSNFQPNNKSALFIDHNLGGGANYYSRDYIDKCIKNGKKIFYLFYDTNEEIYKLDFLFKEYKIKCFFNHFSEIETLFKFFKINEIIVNEIVSHKRPLEVLGIIKNIFKKYEVPIRFLVHDYFCLCPKYDLLGYKGRFCELPSEQECVKCLFKNRDLVTRTVGEMINIKKWREEWKKFFESVSEIVCFSKSSYDFISKIYPNVLTKIVIRPHQVDYIRDETPDEEFLIGILGDLNETKGIRIVKKMSEIIKKEKKQVKIVVLGKASENIRDENIVVHGGYQRENLPKIVRGYGINVFFVASVVPETFSYTTEEIIKMEYPVACFNLGAQADKIKEYSKGMIIPEIKAKNALDTLLELGSRYT